MSRQYLSCLTLLSVFLSYLFFPFISVVHANSSNDKKTIERIGVIGQRPVQMDSTAFLFGSGSGGFGFEFDLGFLTPTTDSVTSLTQLIPMDTAPAISMT